MYLALQSVHSHSSNDIVDLVRWNGYEVERSSRGK